MGITKHLVILAPIGLALIVCSQSLAGRPPRQVARSSAPRASTSEHPLTPVMQYNFRSRDNLQRVNDYTCLFTKRERIDGKLTEHQQIMLKVRHKPFSVYMRFLGPESLEGQEALYVEGRNNNKLLAHSTGLKRLVGTVALDPQGDMAMRGNLYPITEVGILKMVNRIIGVAEHDMQYGECDVQYFQGAKVDGRACTCIQVIHPVPRRNFEYYMSRVFIDDQYQIIVRAETYDWPARSGEQPPLLAEYTYSRIRFNVGLTDLDFSTSNSQYDYE